MSVKLQDQVTTLPQKLLAAWINKSRKEGAPQLTCNNNFAKAISNIFPLTPCPIQMLP
jgi:hypothetical protein